MFVCVFFTLTDRASTIPSSNIHGCQPGTWCAGQEKIRGTPRLQSSNKIIKKTKKKPRKKQYDKKKEEKNSNKKANAREDTVVGRMQRRAGKPKTDAWRKHEARAQHEEGHSIERPAASHQIPPRIATISHLHPKA